ncbi:MAG TPA: membrane protein insertase YidC [Candidatus Polarisedimenticolia bacterium]|nr:membrane protein insertase YidC [Candidatus Polarisedimenticolia bacterium]
MEKRALVAVLLSVAVIVLWQIFFIPPVTQGPSVPPPAAESSGAAPGPGEAEPPAPVEGPPAPTPAAEAIQAEAAEEFRLITGTQDVRLTNQGGRVTWWRLPRYTLDEGRPVDLIPEQAAAADVLPLQVKLPGDEETSRRLATALHRHEIEEIPAGDPSGLGPGRRVAFSYADGKGLAVRKSLALSQDGYVARASLEVTRDGRPVPAVLVWATGLSQPVVGDTSSYGHVEGQAVVHDGSSVNRMLPGKLERRVVYGPATGTPVLWAGLESTYFASLALGTAGEKAAPLTLVLEPVLAPPRPGAAAEPLLTAGLHAEGPAAWKLFVGPKDYRTLEALGQDLTKAIHFSDFSLIYLCTKGLFLALTWINGYVGNYGWSIIILTFVVRLAFFPITYRSSITMRQTSKKMAKLAPRVKSIQEKYRKMKRSMETQAKMNEEIMGLYKKEGVNPMSNLGGCLPLLLQMPVFIGFYNLLAVTIEMRQAPFLGWLQDLSLRDPYYITPLLMGASWLLQQAMTSSSIPDPMQRRMMMFMPVMFTFFMMHMPSGLVIYWLTSNLLGMAQQFVINRKADQLEAGHRAREAAAGARRAEDGQTA